MMSRTFASLSADVFETICAFLSSSGVFTLWLCGNSLVNAKLAQPGVVNALRIALHPIRPRWPSAAFRFSYLEELDVSASVNPNFTFVPEVEVERLPKTIKKLRFAFANGFSCFLQRSDPPSEGNPALNNIDGYHLRQDLDELLPNLQECFLSASVQHHALPDAFVSFFPSSLVDISFPKSYPFSIDMISMLPRLIEKLELTLRGQELWDECLVDFPPNLASFICHNTTSFLMLPHLPDRVSSLVLTNGSPGTGNDLLGQTPTKWPAALTSLAAENLFCIDTLWYESFLRSLPPTLLTFSHVASPFTVDLLKYLPPSLTEWNATILRWNDPVQDRRLIEWSHLPKNLTHAPEVLLRIVYPEDWGLLPRGLRTLSSPNTYFAENGPDPSTVLLLPPSLTDFTMNISQSTSIRFIEQIAHAPLQNTLRRLQLEVMPTKRNVSALGDNLRHFQVLEHLLISSPPVTPISCDEIYQQLPSTLTSLEIRQPLSGLYFSSLAWASGLKHLKLQVAWRCDVGIGKGPHIYDTLPRGLEHLTWLPYNMHLPSYGFKFLPRTLRTLELGFIDSLIDDASIESFPPRLTKLVIHGQGGARPSPTSLRKLSPYLTYLSLPGLHLTENDYVEFLSDRPNLEARFGGSPARPAENIFKAYAQQHLVLGNLTYKYQS